MITDDLNSGDRVRTDSDGRVEILLNPGSYLRLGGNSEVELLDNSLANLEVRLLRGTAIVEATGADNLDLNIGVSTPHARLAIVRQYPTLVDGAFIIIAMVGTKLLLEYADAMSWIHFEPPKWITLTIIVITFLIAYVQARRKGPVPDSKDDDAAAALLDQDNG